MATIDKLTAWFTGESKTETVSKSTSPDGDLSASRSDLAALKSSGTPTPKSQRGTGTTSKQSVSYTSILDTGLLDGRGFYFPRPKKNQLPQVSRCSQKLSGYGTLACWPSSLRGEILEVLSPRKK